MALSRAMAWHLINLSVLVENAGITLPEMGGGAKGVTRTYSHRRWSSQILRSQTRRSTERCVNTGSFCFWIGTFQT